MESVLRQVTELALGRESAEAPARDRRVQLDHAEIVEEERIRVVVRMREDVTRDRRAAPERVAVRRCQARKATGQRLNVGVEPDAGNCAGASVQWPATMKIVSD